jgi:DNA transposition AAA+ family ATPase
MPMKAKSIKVDEDLWAVAGALAAAGGTSITELIRRDLQERAVRALLDRTIFDALDVDTRDRIIKLVARAELQAQLAQIDGPGIGHHRRAAAAELGMQVPEVDQS